MFSSKQIKGRIGEGPPEGPCIECLVRVCCSRFCDDYIFYHRMSRFEEAMKAFEEEKKPYYEEVRKAYNRLQVKSLSKIFKVFGGNKRMNNGDFGSIEEYSDLVGTGFEGRVDIPPEEEFFHAVYVAGQTRKNHIGITEEENKLQIRGVQYNLNEVNFIITNVKEVLVKGIRDAKNQESIQCFCYKSAEPWKGTSGRVCGENSAARAANEFCNICRAQIIVSGVCCESSGKPVLDSEGKPVFMFIRGKGMKYSNVAEYLGELHNRDLDPIFEPVTEDSKKFEKSIVNNKRFVTRITIGEAQSNFGMKKVFNLNAGEALPKNAVMGILKISKKTMENFNEKFDWARRRASISDYGNTVVGEDQQFPGQEVDSAEPTKTPESEKTDNKMFDFGDLKF